LTYSPLKILHRVKTGGVVVLLERDKPVRERLAAEIKAFGLELCAADSVHAFTSVMLEPSTMNEARLVLLDHRLLGPEPLKALAECVRLSAGVPVVLMTAGASNALAGRAGALGVRATVPRPFGGAALKSLLEGRGEPLEPAQISIERLVWEHIQVVFEESDRNVSRAALTLGIDRRTLQRKLKRPPRA